MANGRTKNKRARKPEIPVNAGSKIPAAPTAYFDFQDAGGYAEANSGGRFFHPSVPVTSFRVFALRQTAVSLEWSRESGWTGNVPREILSYVVASIEKVFSPMRYRFKPISI